MASTTTTTEPPYYILVSHSTLVNTTGGTSPTSLGHPIIQYHYADDSPLSLLPHTADEHVLVLDYDNVATMKSISKNLAVTGIKVSEAPGAAAAHDELKIERNDKIYILETCTTMEDSADASQADLQNAQSILARFKQRNAVLHRVLDYPDASRGDATQVLLSNASTT